jgi:hypothetical protein
VSTPNPPDLAGSVIAGLIAKEIDSTRADASSLQARGLAVISSAGTLVTLLFGLSALSTQAKNFVLPATVKPPLFAAAGLLVIAAILGIATNAPRITDKVNLNKLGPLLEDQWYSSPAVAAQQEVARTQLAVAQRSRVLTVTLARFLLASIIVEIVGVACVVWAVVALIVSG